MDFFETKQPPSFARYIRYAERRCDFLFRTRVASVIVCGWLFTAIVCVFLYCRVSALSDTLQLVTDDFHDRIVKLEQLAPTLRKIGKDAMRKGWFPPELAPFGQEDLSVIDGTWVHENLGTWQTVFPLVVKHVYANPDYARNHNVQIVREVLGALREGHGTRIRESLSLYIWNGVRFGCELTFSFESQNYYGGVLYPFVQNLQNEWFLNWSKRLYEHVYRVARATLDVSMADKFREFAPPNVQEPWKSIQSTDILLHWDAFRERGEFTVIQLQALLLELQLL